MFSLIKKLHKFLDRENNPIIEMKTSKDPICPIIKKVCIGTECLAFKTFEQEWDETEMITNDETGRMEDINTGRRLKGTIANCKLGVFNHLTLNQEVIEEKSKKSKLVVVS